jgi:sec-independent protein translocase protein TatC
MTAASNHTIPPRDDEPDIDPDRGDGRMGFLEHLDELRTRIIRSCLAIGAGMLVAFFFHDRIGDFVLAPTLRALPAGDALIVTKPGEGFAFYLDIALIGGLVLSSPFVAYQLWRFIAPGLYAREKRFAVPFVALVTIGSAAGALFAHYVMFPATIAFLAGFHSRAMKFTPRVEDTFDLYKLMLVGMVVVFQIPTVVFFLAKMRMVTARFLWRHIKYAVLAAFVAAAVLTPSADPWNQTLFALPIIGLYVISIGIAWVAGPRRRKPASRDRDGAPLRLIVTGAVIENAWARRKRARVQSRVNLR